MSGTGGIIGLGYGVQLNNSKADNVYLENTEFLEIAYIRNGSSYCCYKGMGGIIGTGYGNTINNGIVNDLKIDYKMYNQDTVKYENIGGIAGFASSASDCNVNNATIIVENVNNASIEEHFKDNTNNVGGILGYGHEVTGCEIKNSKIEHKGELNYATAGILGHADTTTTTIRNCNVENTEIIGKALTGGICSATATNLTIDNCTVKDSTVKGTDRVGGLLGMSYDGSTNTDLTLDLINNKIQNTNILGKNDYNYYIGWTMPEEKTPVLTGTSYDAQTTLETY